MKTLEQILYEYGLNLSNPLRVALKEWLQQKQNNTPMENQKAIICIDELLEELK